MKKIVFSIIAIAGMLALAGCDTKQCRCYEYNGTRWIKEYSSVIVGTHCNSLNTSTYQCDEMSDPEIDPNSIGEDTKKNKK